MWPVGSVTHTSFFCRAGVRGNAKRLSSGGLVFFSDRVVRFPELLTSVGWKPSDVSDTRVRGSRVSYARNITILYCAAVVYVGHESFGRVRRQQHNTPNGKHYDMVFRVYVNRHALFSVENGFFWPFESTATQWLERYVCTAQMWFYAYVVFSLITTTCSRCL